MQMPRPGFALEGAIFVTGPRCSGSGMGSG